LIYAISKIFTAFFLPPGLFILLLAAASILVKRWRALFSSAAILFYLLSIDPFADRLLEPFEAPYRTSEIPDNVDAVVMLGGGKVQGSPNLPLKDEAFKRALHALVLAKRLDRPLVVSGGGLHGYTEYDAFRDSLKDLRPLLGQMPEYIGTYEKRFAILEESRSVDTYQNLHYTGKLLPPSPKIAVVTSAYHMKRAMMLCRHFGLDAIPAATDFHVSKEPYDLYDLLPTMHALHNSYRAIHEMFGIVKVALRNLVGGQKDD